MEKKVVLGIILGDHAGGSPERVAKAFLANEGPYIPGLTEIWSGFAFPASMLRVPTGWTSDLWMAVLWRAVPMWCISAMSRRGRISISLQ